MNPHINIIVPHNRRKDSIELFYTDFIFQLNYIFEK